MSNVKRVSVDGFASAVESMLREYGDDVFKASEKAAKASARAAVKQLKATSKVKRGATGGKYARGWTTKTTGKNTAEFRIVVHNRTAPGLAHLLNDSHVTGRYRGGHYTGDNTVTNAEEMAKASFLKGVESAL